MVSSAAVSDRKAMLLIALRIVWVVVRVILVLWIGFGHGGRFFYQGF